MIDYVLRPEEMPLCLTGYSRGSYLLPAPTHPMDLPLPERDWLLERIAKERTREAKEIEKAGKKKR